MHTVRHYLFFARLWTRSVQSSIMPAYCKQVKGHSSRWFKLFWISVECTHSLFRLFFRLCTSSQTLDFFLRPWQKNIHGFMHYRSDTIKFLNFRSNPMTWFTWTLFTARKNDFFPIVCQQSFARLTMLAMAEIFCGKNLPKRPYWQSYWF